MATWIFGSGWGTRENAIPGEWALLVLCTVVTALLGAGVFWFTTLRHERAMLNRAQRRPAAQTFGLELIELEPEAGLEGEAGLESEAELESTVEPEGELEPETVGVSESEPACVSEPVSEPAAEPASEPEPEPQPQPEPEPVHRSALEGAGVHRLTDEMIERVALERSRRKSVKWKELAALIHREFGIHVHPRTIERALKRRRSADRTDPASADPASDPA